jgi:hypothetical protein
LKGHELNYQNDSQLLNYVTNLDQINSSLGAWCVVGKFFLRAKTFLEIFFQSEIQLENFVPQSGGTHKLAILQLAFGSNKKNCHLDVALARSYKIYHVGEENGDSSQVQVMVNYVSSWLVYTPIWFQMHYEVKTYYMGPTWAIS